MNLQANAVAALSVRPLSESNGITLGYARRRVWREGVHRSIYSCGGMFAPRFHPSPPMTANFPLHEQTRQRVFAGKTPGKGFGGGGMLRYTTYNQHYSSESGSHEKARKCHWFGLMEEAYKSDSPPNELLG